jgi:hypothetical protein
MRTKAAKRMRSTSGTTETNLLFFSSIPPLETPAYHPASFYFIARRYAPHASSALGRIMHFSAVG